MLNDLPIYQEGQAPSFTQRQALLKKYHAVYHRAIANRKKNFILDGHSTMTGHTDATATASLMTLSWATGRLRRLIRQAEILTAPEGYLETYAEELERRLAGLESGVAGNPTLCCNVWSCDGGTWLGWRNHAWSQSTSIIARNK